MYYVKVMTCLSVFAITNFCLACVFRKMFSKFQRCKSKTFLSWEQSSEMSVLQVNTVSESSTLMTFSNLELQELANIGKLQISTR